MKNIFTFLCLVTLVSCSQKDNVFYTDYAIDATITASKSFYLNGVYVPHKKVDVKYTYKYGRDVITNNLQGALHTYLVDSVNISSIPDTVIYRYDTTFFNQDGISFSVQYRANGKPVQFDTGTYFGGDAMNSKFVVK